MKTTAHSQSTFGSKAIAFAPLAIPCALLIALVAGVALKSHSQYTHATAGHPCTTSTPCNTPRHLLSSTRPAMQATTSAAALGSAAPRSPAHSEPLAGYHHPLPRLSMPYYSFGHAVTVADKG